MSSLQVCQVKSLMSCLHDGLKFCGCFCLFVFVCVCVFFLFFVLTEPWTENTFKGFKFKWSQNSTFGVPGKELAMLGSVPYPNTDQPCMSFEISNLRSSGSNQSPSLPTPLRKEQPFHLQLTLYTQHLLLECSRTRKRSNASQLGLKQQEQGSSVLFQSSSLPTYVKRMFPKNKPNP